jgi:hypothetical protein
VLSGVLSAFLSEKVYTFEAPASNAKLSRNLFDLGLCGVRTIESDWTTKRRYRKVRSRSVVRHQRLELDQVQGVHGRCSDPEVATNVIAGFAESQRKALQR